MAIYLHNARALSYSLDGAPFAFDLVLLQPSRFAAQFWSPFGEELKAEPSGGGRFLVCDWFDAKLSPQEMAEDLFAMLNTLGLLGAQVVACEDAVEIVERIKKSHADALTKVLVKERMPSTGELHRAIRDFCGI